jgi:conjugal transfer/entry exclusion protein
MTKIKKIRLYTALLILSLFISLTPTRTHAIYGVADVVIDPTNLVQNTTSAIANPITAAMTTLEKVKHYVLDPLAWTLAKKLFKG